MTFLSLDARARDTHTPTQGRKKKFIDKKESSTFHVVHRSQQDKANEGEEEASEFVLIPSGVSYLLQTACQTFVCVCVLFEKQHNVPAGCLSCNCVHNTSLHDEIWEFARLVDSGRG